jgi:hypothetical protein
VYSALTARNHPRPITLVGSPSSPLICLLVAMSTLVGCRTSLTSVRGFRVQSYDDGVFSVLHERMEYKASCKGSDRLDIYGETSSTCPTMMESVGRELEPQAAAVDKKIPGIKERGQFLVLFTNNPGDERVESLQIISKRTRE